MEERMRIYIRSLYKSGRISKQAMRTYIGQVNTGNVDACMKGLARKGLLIL